MTRKAKGKKIYSSAKKDKRLPLSKDIKESYITQNPCWSFRRLDNDYEKLVIKNGKIESITINENPLDVNLIEW